MNKRLSTIVITLVIALALIACDNNVTEEKPAVTSSESAMQVIKLSDWKEIRQQFLPKILVADLWASWCVSCIERFPAMVALGKKYQHHPVQFISLNLDDPSDTDALKWSSDFLKKMQANFPHYHLQENMMHSFEQLDLLGIPVVLVYNQAGIEKYKLTGDNPNKQFAEDDVEQAIVALLKELKLQ